MTSYKPPEPPETPLVGQEKTRRLVERLRHCHAHQISTSPEGAEVWGTIYAEAADAIEELLADAELARAGVLEEEGKRLASSWISEPDPPLLILDVALSAKNIEAIYDYVTAMQAKARADALEKAARVCEDLARRDYENVKGPVKVVGLPIGPADTYTLVRTAAGNRCDDCAQLIRELLHEPPPPAQD